MLIRPYDHETDFEYAIQLLESRDMSKDLISDLPKFGLIGLKNGTPIAMGFIRAIEGKYAMLDSYITNSYSSPEDRSRALDLITYKLIKLAKDNTITKLFAFSSEKNIVDRSIRHGFGAIQHKMTLKVLA